MTSGVSQAGAEASEARLLRSAKYLLPLLVFSLAFMKPPIRLFGFSGAPADFIFLAALLLWGAALLKGEARFRWNNAYWLLALYFAAMAASAIASDNPEKAGLKLATQAYLLSLPVLAASLIDRRDDLRRVFRWWLAGTAVVVAVAVVSLAAFAIDPGGPIYRYMRFGFGTLPAASYPRLSLTFLNANMLCDYLTVSLAILLVCWRLGWTSNRLSAWFAACIVLTAAFTISPGLGGVALAAGLWLWLIRRGSGLGRLALAAGGTAAILFVGAMALTPILHPTAPFLVRVPGLDFALAPAGRMMTWMDAARNFLADPLLGRGIGENSVHVRYLNPSGELQNLYDAHNIFLNVAVQSGIAGLGALLLIVGYLLRRSRPWKLLPGDSNAIRLGLGLAFLNAFAYQGLGGSFEDARHLWVLLGLFLAACRVEESEAGG